MSTNPIRVLTFTGTRTQFVGYLLGLIIEQDGSLIDASSDEYQWDLTASIARHPAGKGLTPHEEVRDAVTLAHWCARSDVAYNCGAWQTALLLRPAKFRRMVADALVSMDLADDAAAWASWRKEIADQPPPKDTP